LVSTAASLPSTLAGRSAVPAQPRCKMSSVKPEDSGLDASTHLAHVQMLIAEVTRGDPAAAHARYSVAMSLLSYAEKLDNHREDAVLTRTCRMLEAEYRGDVPLGTWAASPEPKIAWEHLRAKPKPRLVAHRSRTAPRQGIRGGRRHGPSDHDPAV
jgi:hypothetical protein